MPPKENPGGGNKNDSGKSKNNTGKGKNNQDKSQKKPEVKIKPQGSDAGSYISAKSKVISVQELEERKQRERDEHPERRLLFKPRVYESWKEDEDLDDEIAEQEALIAEISKKEHERKKKKEDGDYDSSDESDDSLAAQKAALERLKSRQHREDAYKERMAKQALREEQERALEDEEKHISELHNPTKYGWFYTDGYYNNAPYFGVKEELIEKLNEDREVWKEKWLARHPESFTEKFKRFFWPPKLLMKNRIFRTRGAYMDFPEVIADWPKASDITFDKKERELISNTHPIFEVTGEGVVVEEEKKDAVDETKPEANP